MRGVLGVLGLLLTLGMVAILAKKQLPAAAEAGAPAQSQQIQQQVQQQVEAAMQQPRAMPDEK